MDVQINTWGVILAALSSMVVGSVWYAKGVFGNTWMKLTKAKMGSDNMGKAMGLTFLMSLVTAYVLAHVSYLSNQFFHNSFFQDSVSTAFWMWLGFTAARMYTHDLFEGRPGKLTLLNAAHELTTFLAMGAIIGWLGV